MRLEMNPREMLASLAGGALAALLIVLISGLVGQVSPASAPVRAPVRAPLVNCISARMRSRQGSTASISAQVRRAERQCATQDQNAARGAQATPLAQSVPDVTSSTPKTRATKPERNHGWRKAATPSAN